MEPRWLSLTTVALGLNQIDKLSSSRNWFNGGIVIKLTEVSRRGVAFMAFLAELFVEEIVRPVRKHGKCSPIAHRDARCPVIALQVALRYCCSKASTHCDRAHTKHGAARKKHCRR